MGISSVMIFFIITCIMCLTVAVQSFIKFVRHIVILKTGVKCMAKITEWKTEQTKGVIQYRPQLSFTDSDGREHSVTSPSAYNNTEKFAIGQEVSLHYDDNDPERIVFGNRELAFSVINFVQSLLFPAVVYYVFIR